mgnify:CR=1 FL=1
MATLNNQRVGDLSDDATGAAPWEDVEGISLDHGGHQRR